MWHRTSAGCAVEIVLGLGAALTYGAADFVGGFVTRRTHVLAVVIGSQLVGAVALAVVMPALTDEPATGRALAWGAASGLAAAIGVMFLYRGLAGGRMSVVAPVTAVVAATLPVIFGLVVGERPPGVALAGVAVALAAIGLISRPAPRDREDAEGSGSGVGLALVAGVGFAAFFILLERAGPAAGLWPLVGARASSILLTGALALLTSAPLRAATGTARPIAVVGLLDAAANVLYLLATQRGLLSLVAVLTSMYPATTVLLARFLLGERLTRTRAAGLGVAATAVALIAAG
jgi:drug/metabolite transporter (DMT)-like permease